MGRRAATETETEVAGVLARRRVTEWKKYVSEFVNPNLALDIRRIRSVAYVHSNTSIENTSSC